MGSRQMTVNWRPFGKGEICKLGNGRVHDELQQ